ncbi:LOW QUALITY PROTEIN: immunoglobulin iota chain-like [Ammospiza caudacuta]|uniref:LOW QUALITY PROTEIN: immunoglobulin iota chain-like n=1 Tax=Ammospiza caudacuta TaxID=2857398 RepID=UPI002739122A|nr:LOW QUALITY PROTEIN: immunoglobulin iota chain-like [Ammospiza caudacuta]
MRWARAAGLPALVAVLIVAASRAQVQQEPFLETTEGTGINITCSHAKIQPTDWIQWYRQLPGQGPELLALTLKDTKELPGSAGQLSVSADRRSSWLWLAEPRRGDAAVYYCALGARAEEPGLRPGTNRRGRGRNRHRHRNRQRPQNRHRHRQRQWDRQQHRQWTLLPITNGTGTDTIDTTTVIDPSGASRGRCRSARRAPEPPLRSSFLCPEPAMSTDIHGCAFSTFLKK